MWKTSKRAQGDNVLSQRAVEAYKEVSKCPWIDVMEFGRNCVCIYCR